LPQSSKFEKVTASGMVHRDDQVSDFDLKASLASGDLGGMSFDRLQQMHELSEFRARCDDPVP